MSQTGAITNMGANIRVISLFASVAVHAAVLMGIPTFIGETGTGTAESSSTLYISVQRSEPADAMPRDNPDRNSQKQQPVQPQVRTPPPQRIVQQPDSLPKVPEVRAAPVTSRFKPNPKTTATATATASVTATDAPASNKRGANVNEKQPMQVAASGKSVRLSRDYRSTLIRLIERNKFYPLRARRSGLEGMVKVSFTVSNIGNISNITLTQSSGNSLLDQAATQTIKRIGQAPPFPEGIGRSKWEFVIPMTYDLK
jgi:periplasmic protein TonB